MVSLIVLMQGTLLTSCATALPDAKPFYHVVAESSTNLRLDVAVVNSIKVSKEKQQLAEELLSLFHSVKNAYNDYMDALRAGLQANEQLDKSYSTADAVVGAIGGLSGVGVAFATPFVAVVIAATIWEGIGFSIQRYHVEPAIEQFRQEIEALHRVKHELHDASVAFNELITTRSEEDADRRFAIWKSRTDDLCTAARELFHQTC